MIILSHYHHFPGNVAATEIPVFSRSTNRLTAYHCYMYSLAFIRFFLCQRIDNDDAVISILRQDNGLLRT